MRLNAKFTNYSPSPGYFVSSSYTITLISCTTEVITQSIGNEVTYYDIGSGVLSYVIAPWTHAHPECGVLTFGIKGKVGKFIKFSSTVPLTVTVDTSATKDVGDHSLTVKASTNY